MDRLPISPAGGGRALLAKFIAPPNTVTTSPPIQIPNNTQGLVIVWREITTFQISPVQVTVSDGTIIWGQFSIGFNSTTNVRASVLTVPIAPEISSQVTVTVDEDGTAATHEISVIGVADNIFRTTLLSGSGVVTPTNLTSVGPFYQPLLTTFGEMAVSGYGGSTILTAAPTANLPAVVTLAAVTGFNWHVLAITAGYSAGASGPGILTATDGFQGRWQSFVATSGAKPHDHFTFPDGGLSFLNSAPVTITLPAGGAGVSGMVSVCASNRLFGS